MSHPQPKLPSAAQLIRKHSTARYLGYTWDKEISRQSAVESQVRKYR